ncbi:DUF3224 domain-containing protein [Catellatospora vulcania]|uniref:DUF3224 domain-containing protein n=1 Tax=Catellatospora vulcania TaxID=1460450 RepID=UPI0018AFB893|nr:DUF3224 domain-containing protein [Catellatospora vulcania]
MSKVAVALWDQDAWDEHNYFEPAEGHPLIRADVKRTLHGDIEGTSEAILLCCRPDAKSAGYVANEHVAATIAGRRGTFVLQHVAAMGGETPHRLGFIVPNSGTGELAGLRGSCTFGHDEQGRNTLRLDYDLD